MRVGAGFDQRDDLGAVADDIADETIVRVQRDTFSFWACASSAIPTPSASKASANILASFCIRSALQAFDFHLAGVRNDFEPAILDQ